jgi:hypothetical protein
MLIGQVKLVYPATATAVRRSTRRCHTPTKLNGEPVEVVSTVIVNFVLQ